MRTCLVNCYVLPNLPTIAVLPVIIRSCFIHNYKFFHFISQSYYLFRRIADRDNTEFQLDIG